MLSLILFIAAFVLFVLAAIAIPVPRVNLTAAGLACAMLGYLLVSHTL